MTAVTTPALFGHVVEDQGSSGRRLEYAGSDREKLRQVKVPG